MEKTAQKTSNKESLMQILASVSPGLDLDDEETVYGRILDDYNSYAELLDSDNERKKADEQLEVEYRHNTAASMTEIEQMTISERLDSDEVEQAISELKRISAETTAGNYTTENIKIILAYMHRDADMETARREGEIAGRNAAIDTQLQKDREGDGLPMLTGADNGVSRRRQSIFDIARS